MAPPDPLRLAYFSPLPPTRSGIADYSHELLPHLAQHANLTLFVSNPEAVTAILQQNFVVQKSDHYTRWQHDLALYHIGNSHHHKHIYQTALRYPGIVILHDFFLHHFIVHHTVGQNNYPAYTRELGYALGPEGINLAWQIKQDGHSHPLFEHPLNNRLLDSSLGLIVHSHYVQKQVQQLAPHCPVQVIPALIEPHPGYSRRQELGLPTNALLFASVGQVTAAKQIAFALRVFKRVRQANPHAFYLIVGETLPEIDLPNLIAELDLTDAVRCLGYIDSLSAFIDWIHTADVIINLRHPTIGETSATALRALAAARPLIVFDHGWYRELPTNACLHIPPLDEQALLTAMKQLAQSATMRQQLGQAGLDYIHRHCRPEHVAIAYMTFLQARLAAIGVK